LRPNHPLVHRVQWLFLLVAGALIPSGCARRAADITQQELVRRTQEMMDAVAPGDRAPWERYLAVDCMYFDEMGHDFDKQAMLAQMAPLPRGLAGSIAVVGAHSHIEGDVAILSYDLDEKETVFGQLETARYHATDTWMRRNGTWQIVAGQIFRYYADPAPAEVDGHLLSDYVGSYEVAPRETLTVSQDGGHLYRQRGDAPRSELVPETADLFFRHGVEGRILFHRDGHGAVDRLIDRRNNEDVVWRKLAGN
jgi:hypothetical protein